MAETLQDFMWPRHRGTRDELKALLARLHKSDGTDRQLDLDVWCAVTGEQWEWIKDHMVSDWNGYNIARQVRTFPKGITERTIELLTMNDPPDVCVPRHITSNAQRAIELAEQYLPVVRGFPSDAVMSSGWKLTFYRAMQPTAAPANVAPRGRWQCEMRRHAEKGHECRGPNLALAIITTLVTCLLADMEEA